MTACFTSTSVLDCFFSQVLLKASRKLEITGREIGTVGGVIHILQAVGLCDKTHFHLDALSPS